MVATAEAINQLSIQVVKSIEIDAPLEVAFEELLEQMGPANVTPDGTPMPMKMEPWPDGRWFRDLGKEYGHFWGHICDRKSGWRRFRHPGGNQEQYGEIRGLSLMRLTGDLTGGRTSSICFRQY